MELQGAGVACGGMWQGLRWVISRKAAGAARGRERERLGRDGVRRPLHSARGPAVELLPLLWRASYSHLPQALGCKPLLT